MIRYRLLTWINCPIALQNHALGGSRCCFAFALITVYEAGQANPGTSASDNSPCHYEVCSKTAGKATDLQLWERDWFPLTDGLLPLLIPSVERFALVEGASH